jgi:Zn-dependent peptidase ImmA (M78 family)
MSLKTPRSIIVEATASQVLKDQKIDRLPIDPKAIATSADILVQAKPPENDGFSGMLAQVGQSYGILYATYIDSEGFQNFSIAHELGHYFLPGHMEQLLSGGPHQSRAGFASTDPYEQEADIFAAALLMPERLVKPLLKRNDDGMDLVRRVAALCCTSLTATAIRYAKLADSAVAIVLSTGGVVNFCIFSDAMKVAKVRWMRPGSTIPSGTVTSEFVANEANVRNAATASGEVNLADWFECPAKHTVNEEVIGLGSYGKVLTVIHSSRLSAAADGMDDDEVEDEALEESWTPRFR